MVENPALRMSAFVDCGSQSIVHRVPYKLAVDMLKYCPPSNDKDQLLSRVKIAAARSKLLSQLLKGEMPNG